MLASVCLYSCYYVWKAAATPEKGVCVCVGVGGEAMQGQGVTKGGENGECSWDPLGPKTPVERMMMGKKKKGNR